LLIETTVKPDFRLRKFLLSKAISDDWLDIKKM